MTTYYAFDCGACVPEAAVPDHVDTCTLCHELRSQS